VSLDGEVIGRVPGEFTLVSDALRVVVPREQGVCAAMNPFYAAE
jgi:diacylglycerol kinase family enzyme